MVMINVELSEEVSSKEKEGHVFMNFSSHENILCLK